jgi:hypothetical protein
MKPKASLSYSKNFRLIQSHTQLKILLKLSFNRTLQSTTNSLKCLFFLPLPIKFNIVCCVLEVEITSLNKLRTNKSFNRHVTPEADKQCITMTYTDNSHSNTTPSLPRPFGPSTFRKHCCYVNRTKTEMATADVSGS